MLITQAAELKTRLRIKYEPIQTATATPNHKSTGCVAGSASG